MSTLQIQSPNLGSILKLLLIRTAEVATITSSTAGLQVNLAPGNSWTEIEILEEGAGFRLITERTFDGPAHQLSLQAVHNKIRQNANILLAPFDDADCLALVLDGNEQPWLFGSPAEPLTVEVNANTGNQPQNPNGYNLQATARLTARPLPADPAPFNL